MANSKQNILKRVCEYTVMIVAIALAMAIFSAPAVIFYTFHNNVKVGTWRSTISHFNDLIKASCSSNNNTVINSVGSTSRNWSRSTAQCLPLQVQSRCYNHLKQVLKGKKLSQTNGSLSVQYTGRRLYQLENYVDLIMSTGLTPKCNDLGVPLYCQFLFPPCQGETAPLKITRDQCRRLKDDYCRKEVDFVQSLQSLPIYKMYAYLNPNCSEFEDHQPRRVDHSNDLSTTHQNSTLEGSFETNLTVSACHPSFVRACESSVCLPSCTRAYYADQLSKEMEDATRILGSSVDVVGATVFILLALWKRKEVFSFPTVLVFYQNAVELVVGIVVLIPYVFGKGHLFCSHPDLVRTLHHPPTWFCSTSGVLFQFGAISALLLWLLQLTYITILITFPIFGAQKLKKWNNKIHMTAVPGAFAVSIFAPIVVLATIGYLPLSFPASICFPSNFNAAFYSIALPSCVIMATGIVLMIFIVRNIHKSFKSEVNTLKNRLSNTRSFFSAPEVKMIILSTMMLILGSTIMATFSLTIATQENKFQSITDFSKCQLHGYSSQCNEGDLHNLGVHMALRSFTYIELGLAPLINIFFILKISDFSKVKKSLLTGLKTSELKKGTSG